VWDAAVRGAWALAVGGLVVKPLRLSLADLMRLPRVTQRVNHYCVEGWNASTELTGMCLSASRLAGVRRNARYVDFQSFDEGYHKAGTSRPPCTRRRS
jgi:DMSO/TMAO reductase YedYZ molybdopterin-dependent catalytic subunit